MVLFVVAVSDSDVDVGKEGLKTCHWRLGNRGW